MSTSNDSLCPSRSLDRSPTQLPHLTQTNPASRNIRYAVICLAQADDARAGLLRLACVLQAGLLSPAVLQMRTLVAAQAGQFPDVAADYVTRSWTRKSTPWPRRCTRWPTADCSASTALTLPPIGPPSS